MRKLARVTEQLVSFVQGAPAELPPERRKAIELALIDTIAVAFGAARSHEVAVLSRWASTERRDGPSSCWVDATRTSPAQAALANAFAGHVLEYDDVSPLTRTHPSVVLVPALLAVAEADGVGGRRLFAAYDIGAAAFRALSLSLPAGIHYERGWHTTATVGLLAAVCALAHLVRLDEIQTAHALGLCGSMASGSVRNFGSMAKALQVARAASDAVVTARLAKEGCTANARQLDHPDGFFGMYGRFDRATLDRLGERLQQWQLRWHEDLSVKGYPACYATHRALDALRDLLAGGLHPEQVREISVTVEPGGLAPLISVRPDTGLEGKFSLGYVLAALLHDGGLTLGSFTDEAVRRRHLDPLIESVTAEERNDPPTGPGRWSDGYAVVRVRTVDGDEVTQRRDATRGHASDPLTDEEVTAKLADNLRAAGSAADAQKLLPAFKSLEEADDVGAVLQGLLTEAAP